jgi:hypothetical protein
MSCVHPAKDILIEGGIFDGCQPRSSGSVNVSMAKIGQDIEGDKNGQVGYGFV